ncbi:Uma2 family endonuclease [Nocardiopsis baichengensis]|uniref:Uma2 family endonuclease n=1 Tax=Nocardiopsis baichengensis TaxID=280240 RepID=UPI001EF9F1C9|nr:Uma2 family endonuclease [Nocardiopsis baichengensis]
MSVAEIDAPSPGSDAAHGASEPDMPTPGSLRALADELAEKLPPGCRVEVLGGEIVVSPTPMNPHNFVVRTIMLQMESQLPEDLVTSHNTSVGLDNDDGPSTVPDLLVFPEGAARNPLWLNPPDTVEFVLEVVSNSNALSDIKVKPNIYAELGIPLYLIVDPRNGSLTLHSDPRDGEFKGVHKMEFGTLVKLPHPLDGIEIDTSSFPLYPDD